MSEQEKKSGLKAGGSPTTVVEHKPPYRPTELEDDAPEPPHRRSRAPAVPSVAEELKTSDESNPSNADHKEVKDNEVAPEKYKQNVAKKLSSNTKKREPPPETITLAPLEVVTRKSSLSGAPQPIPPEVSSLSSMLQGANKAPSKTLQDTRTDEDSIVEDVAELRTADPVSKHSEWSDEEEAGGLPRSDSRGSRVSRAVRQLFCCGVPYEAPSEDNISTTRGYAI